MTDPHLPQRFAPTASVTGAVITFDGDHLVTFGDSIFTAAEARLTNVAAAPERRDHWLTPDVPVLSRGEAWIVPLFWMPADSLLDDAERQALSARAAELGQSIMGAGWYGHGDALSIDFEADGGPGIYAAELARAGVTRAAWWAVGSFALVLAFHRASGADQRMALHVVPVGWVWSWRPTPAKKMPPLDLSWTWDEVVSFVRQAE